MSDILGSPAVAGFKEVVDADVDRHLTDGRVSTHLAGILGRNALYAESKFRDASREGYGDQGFDHVVKDELTAALTEIGGEDPGAVRYPFIADNDPKYIGIEP